MLRLGRGRAGLLARRCLQDSLLPPTAHQGPSRAALSRRLQRTKRRRPAAATASPVAQRERVEQRVAETTDSLPALQWSNQDDQEVAPVVGHRALIVGRDIEWANIIIGFEQANKYTVRDERGDVVAYIAEETPSMASAIGRQFLATHRNFVATIFDVHGQVMFRVRRPIYLINSQMFIEDSHGETIGEVVQRWHLWKRNYDLYLNKKQFAQITGSFLAWEFELKDANGGSLALIDRNFQGFGKELFTDAGKYVIHFGMPPEVAADQATVSRQALVEEQTPKEKVDQLPPVTQLAKLRTGVAVIPTQSGGQLAVARNLTLGERSIALACAISIDFDYFSQHSGRPGFLGFGPPLMPIPIPSGGGGEGPQGEAGPDAAGGGDAAPSPPPPPPQGEPGPENDLGGDEFELPEEDGGGSLLQDLFDVFTDSD